MALISMEDNRASTTSSASAMDGGLLEAATTGDAITMQNLAMHDPAVLLGTTPQGNTCLHIASICGHKGFCEATLPLSPSLLAAFNSDGETPLLSAVTSGRVSLASFLLRCCRDQQLSDTILKQDSRGCNALHHAVCSGHRDLALELVEAEPALSQAVNKHGESPMFIAVMRNYDDVLEELLGVPDSAHGGAHGYNALHAAVRSGSSVISKKITKTRPELAREENKDKNTPMHLAVLWDKVDVVIVMSSPTLIIVCYGNGEIIYGPRGVDLSGFPQVTVEHPNPEGASIRDLKDWYKMQGPRKALPELIDRMQPWMDAWEQATQDRVTEQAPYDPTSYHVYLQWYVPRTRTRLVCIQHEPDQAMADLGIDMERDAAEAIAMLRRRDSSGAYDDIIDMFSRLGQKAKRLVQVVTCRQTDDVFTERRAAPSRERPPRPTTTTRGRVKKCNPKMVAALLLHQDIDVTVLDNIGAPAIRKLNEATDHAKTLNWNEISMLMLKADPEDAGCIYNLHKEAKDAVTNLSRKDIKSLTQTYTGNTSLVAILIATITFAAAFTLPGGFSSDVGSEGLPIMAGKVAFQAFLVFDTLAMCSSLVVAFVCVIAKWEDLEFLLYYRSFTKKLKWFALITTTAAFATALYTVLATRVPWLAVMVCVLTGLLPILTKFLGEWPILKLRFRLGRKFKSELLDMV
ncbi:unnamed protein product [Urochloa decumbens]|uniref:PGG domain-containing protein n=1 Tax=Urochloa decumbens TaxID=240449 RepID=A0ABC9B739_9POAL